MNEVLRQEKKFLIGTEQFYRYNHHLSQIMQADAHGGSDGYSIRSLYFDSLDDRDLQEKEAGVELRRKIRLRIYDSAAQSDMLEIKRKEGNLQRKSSLQITKEEAQALIEGRYHVLLHYPQPMAAECYYIMNQYVYRPRTLITYQRRAFVAKENKIRVTFDHHIKATESSFDLFSEKLPDYYVFEPSLVVLEVKYNGFLLEYIKEMLRECNASERSVSKYCMGRSIGRQY